MKQRRSFYLVVLVMAVAARSQAGPMQRIGHTTLLPQHISPPDKGMYAATIDPVNGYAYFVGSYLHKVDITGSLPVEVCPSFYVGQYTHASIDPAAGYVYFTKNSVNRFNCGAGTNAPTASGSLSLAAGYADEMVVDDSDPNPANHYGYAVCAPSSGPGRVAKIALSTFTEINSIPLAASETNFIFGAVADPAKGYAYFAGGTGAGVVPYVVKIKMTPGTNAPVRIGAVNLDTVPESIDGGCIDTAHGYAYYGTYDSNTNNPGIIYKLKLGDGDVAPTLAGKTVLKLGQGLLSAAVADPTNGFVYFANDNSYPASVCQLSMNGSNAPVEIAYLALQGGTNSVTPSDGTTAANIADDGTNLPYGEVYIRSAVIDPIRGNFYLGQDSRPNQMVKLQLAKVDQFTLGRPQISPAGGFQFNFTNISGVTFTAVSATSLTQPANSWGTIGSVVETSPGQYQFTDPQPASTGQHFYRVHPQ